jgi:hypothetical protein
MDPVYLLYFNLAEGERQIYMMNINLREFFEFFGMKKFVRLTSFFGYHTEYFYETDLTEFIRLEDILNFIDKNDHPVVTTIEFEMDFKRFSVDNCTEFTIESDNLSHEYLRKMIAHFTKLSIQEDRQFLELQDKYLLVQNGVIKEVFKDFGEYTQLYHV